MSRKQAISSCQCCVYTPLPSWKTPRADEFNPRSLFYDVDASGLSVASSLVRQETYPAGEDPSGGDLAQSVAAAILDGQISGELFVDVLPFAYGKRTVNAGFGMRFVQPFITGVSNVTVQALVPVHQEGPPTHYNYSQYRIGGIGGQLGPVESQFEAVGNRGITALLQLLPGSPGDSWRESTYQAPHYRPTFFRNHPALVRQGEPEWAAVGDNDGAGWPPVPNAAGDPVEGSAVQQIPTWSPGSHEYVQLSYEPNTASTIFANSFWALNGNVRHSRCQTCRDYWVCRFRLTLGDQERLWMPSGNYAHGTDLGLSVVLSQLANNTTVSNTPLLWGGYSTNSAGASPSAVMPIVKVVQTKSQSSVAVLATAYARESDESLLAGAGSSPMGLLYKAGRSSDATPGFSSEPLAGVQVNPFVGVLSVYRNGTLVAVIANTSKANQWRAAAIEQATTDEGSYLLVGDNTADDCNYEMYVLGSIVIDKTPPLGVVKQIGDLYVGDPTGALPEWPTLPGIVPEILRCAEESELCSGGRGWVNVADGSGMTSPASLPVGEYAFRQSGPLKDRAENVMPYLPELRFNVRPLPPNGSEFGPVAAIVLPENNRGTFASAGSWCRSLLYDEPFWSVTIQFTEPVTGLLPSHLKLERRSADGNWAAVDLPLSGQPPPRFAVPELSDEEYSVLTGNVTLTLDPSVANGTKYVLTFRQGHRVHNPVEQPANSVFYLTVDPELDAGKVIGPPGENGDPIETKKCRLATRAMWGIMPAAGKNPELIDTRAFSRTIGGVSSVSKEIAIAETGEGGFPRERPRQINVRTTDDVASGEKKVADVNNCDVGFVPNMPPHPFAAAEGDGTNYGFFGIPTSIHPAPPASVPACAAPSAAQKHSSALCSSGEIIGFNASLSTLTFIPDGLVNQIQAQIGNLYGSDYPVGQMLYGYTEAVTEILGVPYPTAPLADPLYTRVPWETPPPWTHFFQAGQFEPVPIPSGNAMSFSSTLSGYQCQQNIWSLSGIGSHKGWLTASRSVTSYEGLKTSFLGRLELGVRGYYAHVFFKRDFAEAIYTPGFTYFNKWAGGAYLDARQTDYNWVPFALGPFTVTPSQEASLAQGNAVSFVEKSRTFTFSSVSKQAISVMLPQNVGVDDFFPSAASTKRDPNRPAAANYAAQQLKWNELYIVTLTPVFA